MKNKFKRNLFFSLLFGLVLGTSSCEKHSLKKVDLLPGHTQAQHESWSSKVMIATQGEASSAAGLEMIKQGGNAFDAAAAISFAISVERPQSTGIGGGGFMLLDAPEFQSPVALDFREKAPKKAHSKMYLDQKGNPIQGLSLNGVLSSGVPGVVKGVLEMHQKYGKLSREQVMKPAIELAEKGFKVYPHLARAIEERKEVIAQYEATQKIFFKNQKPLKEGDFLIQKDLAKTLKTISKRGINGFYRGWVANAIVNEFKKRNGFISHQDLISYQVKQRLPVQGTYGRYTIYSMSPPSSGGTHIVQILNILEPFHLAKQGVQSADTIHQTASAMQLAFVDRARYMGDSDFVKIPLKTLTSKQYASVLRKKIQSKALKLASSDLVDAFGYESDQTTHFTVMDLEGNVVTSTQTINYLLGSAVVVPGTGIVMNDEMDDFAVKEGESNLFGAVGSKNNLVEPEKRPLSSMSPTIVKNGNQVLMALGTPSGTRILTCVAQVMLNYLEHGLSLWDSVVAVRYHHQWSPDVLRIEEPGLSEKVINKLKEKGHAIEIKDLGCKVQAVVHENQKLHGVSDPRGEGLAVGL